ncbi:hypothetical protein EAH87_14295 [Sphingomonas koreensis]|nr:hypothetical protein EAH87_14295 [Sphingomonas koreensis]
MPPGVTRTLLRTYSDGFQIGEAAVRETVEALRQGSIAAVERASVAAGASTTLLEMERISVMPVLGESGPALAGTAAELVVALAEAADPRTSDSSPLSTLPTAEREGFERMFELIYECSVNRVAARKLIDRITAKVTAPPTS